MNELWDELKGIGRLAFCQAVCGLLLGVLWASLLMAIAMPSFYNAVMTHRMAEDLAGLGRFGIVLGMPSWLWAALAFSVLLVSWIMTAHRINPLIPPFPYSRAKRPEWTWVLVLGSNTIFWIGLFLFGGMDFMSQGSLNPAALAAAAAGGAICWLMLGSKRSEAMFSAPSGEAGASGRGMLAAGACGKELLPTAGPCGVIAAGAAGAAFGLVAGLLLQVAGKVAGFVFYWVLEVFHPSFEMTISQARVVYSLPLVVSAVFFGGGFALVPVWALDGSTLAVRLRRAAFPAVLLAFAGAWVWNLHAYAVAENLWRAGNLTVAASLPDAAAPVWTLVVLDAAGKGPVVKPWPAEARPGYGPSSSVAATEANARKLTEFLAGPGRHSRFRLGGADVLAKIPGVLWDRDAAFKAREAVSYVFGESILDRTIELAWLSKSAPITPGNRERLSRLSDPAHYFIRGRGAFNAAKAWRRFGDPERVRYWLAVARLTYDPSKKGEIVLPAGEPFSAGIVRGRVVLNGKPAAGSKVGLFMLADKARLVDAPAYGSFSGALADSRTLGPDGSFRFDGIGDGSYGLALLAPPGALPVKGPLKAGKLPGVFTISRSAPRAETGSIFVETGR